MSKMKNKLKRVLSLCLVLMLVVTFVQVSVPVKADAADTAEAADMTDMTVDAATDTTDTADTVDTTDTTEAVDKVDITGVTDEVDTADAVDAVNATDTIDTTDKANTADVTDATSDVAVTADTSNYYTLDLNSEVDGECLTHLPDGCTCDLYINGQLEAAGINDIFKQYPYGTTYEFKNFKTGVNLVYANKVQSVYHDSEGNLDKNCQSLKGTVKAYLNSSKYGGMTHVVPIFNTKSVNVTFHRNTSSSDTQTASQTFTYGVAGQSFSDKGWSYAGHTLLGWAYSNNATEAYHTPLNGVLDSWINTEYPKVDLYAVWSANRYTVTYDANGGTNAPVAQSFLYNSGEKLSTQVPVRTGYKFMGWRLGTTVYNPGDSIPSGTMNLNLKAMWIVNSYQVAFNGNGSTNGAMESECFNYDEAKALNKNAYSKDGYSFKNWNTKADGSGTAYSDGQTINKLANGKNISVSINPMAVFNRDGVGMHYDGLKEDNSLTTGIAYKATYTTTQYTSMGFYSMPYYNAIANNKLAGKRIIVTFKAKASNPMQLKTVGLENVSTGPISLGTSWNTYYFTGIIPDNWADTHHAMIFYDPSVVGTVYVGDMSVSIVEPVNLYAQWTPNVYTNNIGHWLRGFKNAEGNNVDKTCFRINSTSFQSQYGNIVTMDSTRAVKAPNGFSLTYFGMYDVDGAWKLYSLGTKVQQKASDMYFEYCYDPISYSITYNLNGGTNNNANPSTYNVLYGVTLKNPTRTGYTFTGWYDEKGNKVTGINEGCNATFSSSEDLYAKLAKRTTGNKTLTARWEPIHYTVTYDANGGTGTMSTDTATYNENYVTKANQFTRTGYEFVGWTTNADGSGSNWTSWIGKPWKWTYTKNITLYAQWKAKTYTITYEPNGGVGDRYTQTATYDAYFKTMKNRFTRTGYTFAGFIDLNGRIGTYAKINKKSFLENNALKHPWQLCKVDSEYQFYNYTDKVWETYCLIYWEGPYNVDYGCSPSNFTLSAKWWANNYTVKLDYKKDVGSSYEKTIVTTYDKAYGELPQPVVQGWTFKGWNTKSDGTGTTVTADTVYKIAGDSTLYAQWQINTYDLSVKHTVSGNMGNKCSDFSFTLNLSGMSGNNITAVFTDASGKQITKTLAMNNGKVVFILKHGETVVFKNVPYNTSYTITENNVRDYIVSSSNASGKVTDNIAATFTSVRNIMVPTSADTNIIAMISIVCVAGIAILLILKKRCKTK